MTVRKPTVFDPNEPLFQESYDRVLLEAQSLPVERVLKVNLDAHLASARVIATLPRLRSLRDQLARLHDFDLARFDKLEDYAKAFNVAESRHLIATKPPEDHVVSYEEALTLRGLLCSDTKNLVIHGVLHADALRALRNRVGYANVSFDLQLLGLLLRDHWALVQGKCATTEAELERAMQLGECLMLGSAKRNLHIREKRECADVRARMFTLFLEAYQDVRAAVKYLRRAEGDANLFAPAIHDNQRPRKTARSRKQEPQPEASANSSLPPHEQPEDSTEKPPQNMSILHEPPAGASTKASVGARSSLDVHDRNQFMNGIPPTGTALEESEDETVRSRTQTDEPLGRIHAYGNGKRTRFG